MADIRAIAEQLVGLTIKEANELAKILEEDYGIKPAAAAVTMAAPAAAAGEAAPGEKTEFDVILSSSGAQKLNVVKVVKDLLGLGLKEAKDLVDAAPSTLKTAVSKADAEDMQKKLSEAGATVEVK